jgi:hypothetical protein
MRTTLTLDEDVAAKLQELAKRSNSSFRVVLNDVLRRGLSVQARYQEEKTPFRLEPFRSAFRPGVDPARLNQLSDDLPP